MSRVGRCRRGVVRRALSVLLVTVLVACTPPNLPAPLSPAASDTTAPAPGPGGTISIGIDVGLRGFNPYVSAQWTPAAAAIASLVLPSAFPAGATADTAPTALVESAAVTSEDPFTVTYQLNQSAAWSDGTPIAAEDFSYLWQSMISTPGVVSPSGYQLISDVRSVDAGKTVEVEFSVPFDDWRTLFSPLLPARLLKGTPGGFATALQTGIPVAGGVYRMESYDPGIGQVTLTRNDKYWTSDVAPNAAVFREGSAGDLIAALGRGDLQAVYLQPDGAASAALAGVDDLRVITAPLPVAARLDFNLGAGHPTADEAVRTAIGNALPAALVRTALAGGNTAGALPVTSRLTLPAQPEAPAAPPASYPGDPSVVESILVAAGYERPGLYFADAGEVLTVVLGYDLADLRATAAARLIQRQLGTAGIQVDLVQLSDADLQQPLTADSVPDVVLRTVPRSSSDLAEAIRATDCSGTLVAQAQAASTSATTTTTTTGTGTVAAVRCDADVADMVDELLAGVDRTADLDARLWASLDEYPVAEPTATLALGPDLAGVAIPTDPADVLWTGVLHTLPTWPITG